MTINIETLGFFVASSSQPGPSRRWRWWQFVATATDDLAATATGAGDREGQQWSHDGGNVEFHYQEPIGNQGNSRRRVHAKRRRRY